MPRPFTPLGRLNLDLIQLRLGRLHLSHSLKSAFLRCRPKNMRRVPVGLRRGWVHAVATTWKAQQAEYLAVMKRPCT